MSSHTWTMLVHIHDVCNANRVTDMKYAGRLSTSGFHSISRIILPATLGSYHHVVSNVFHKINTVTLYVPFLSGSYEYSFFFFNRMNNLYVLRVLLDSCALPRLGCRQLQVRAGVFLAVRALTSILLVQSTRSVI